MSILLKETFLSVFRKLRNQTEMITYDCCIIQTVQLNFSIETTSHKVMLCLTVAVTVTLWPQQFCS